MYSSLLVEIHRKRGRATCRQIQCGQRHFHCGYHFVHLMSCVDVLKFFLSPSNTSQPSNLICRVYKTPRRIGRALDHGNELIGIVEEEIPLLLGGAFSTGLSLSSHCRLWFSNFLFICLEIIQPLNKPTDPGSPLGNTTIHFSISTLEHTFPVSSPVVRGLCFFIKFT